MAEGDRGTTRVLSDASSSMVCGVAEGDLGVMPMRGDRRLMEFRTRTMSLDV